jgi:SAM-dependent methyltransferase
VTGTDYREIRENLRTAYDGAADRRDRTEKQPWKVAEREAFLRRLQQAGCVRLLEIGAGTGQDSLFFAGRGLDVVATDLSPEMVARCRAKGLDARVMDFAGLAFEPASFDAVHAMNCLLHVPDAELPAVLAGIARVLRPGGLFFLGVYGGTSGAGVAIWDDHVPPRYFARRTDEEILQFASEAFDVVDFHVVHHDTELRFQSLTLRVKLAVA